MSIIPDGQYQVANTQFPGQVAQLTGGQPTGIIAGFQNTNDSASMWNLLNVGSQGNQFQLTSVAVTSETVFVGAPSIAEGVSLQGSASPLTWTILPTCNAGEYWMLAPMAPGLSTPSGLVWSLSDGADQTPIILSSISSSPALSTRSIYSQAWTFLPTK